MENISNNDECEGSFVLSDEILPLNIGMEFESEDEAYIYYNKYARMIGFSIRKEYVNKNKTHGYVTSRKLTCYKEGERGDDKRTVKKSRKETRTGCSAHIIISRKSNEKYQIISFEPTHNHPLVAKSCTHLLPSQRSIQGAQGFEINLADDSGINLKSAFDYASLQAGGRSNLGYTLTDHKNFLRSKRKFDLKNGEAASLLKYFERRRMLDPMFQSAIDLDEDDMITNIFWADSQMILDYNNYGDVLSFDTTFRTNKDYRPLALFLGMNNHRQILIFGAALLYDETKKSFEWLFRTFLHVMSEQVPDTFITDQDAAIMYAVEKVMPATSHRLCVWHLGKNAFKNLNHLFTSKDSFPSDFGKLLHHYEYEDDFLHAWKDMLDKYELHDNSWLQTTFALREKWSKAYRKSRFSAGIRSTQLSESFNGSLRRYLKSNLDLSQFFEHFERAVKDKRHKELDAIYDMTQKLSIMKVDYPLLRHARHVYTSPIFDMFQKEWIKSLLVVVNSWKEDESTFIYAVKTCGSTREHVVTSKPSELHVSCSCELFSYLGILCSHSLKILDLMNVKLIIPDQYILKRWTKDATSLCKILTFKTNVEEDPTLKVTRRFRHLCPTFVRIANEASECDEGVELAERYANELIVKLRSLKAKRYGTVSSQADFVHETQNLNAREIIGDAIICSKAKGIKKRESTYRGKKRLKSFTEKLSNKKTFMKKKQIYTCLDQQPTTAICPPICLDNISQFEHESTCTPSSSQPSQDMNISFEELISCEKKKVHYLNCLDLFNSLKGRKTTCSRQAYSTLHFFTSFQDFSKEDSEEELYVPLKLKRGFKTKKMVTKNFKDMEDEDFWKEDSEEQLSVPLKSKRRVKTKKMEYDGWGSKPLIEFLKAIGVETENKISQWDLTTIVNEYVAKKKLNSQVKKNRVICDNWLRYLFGKKFVLRIKIHELLYPHLAENRDESEDEDSNNSEEEEETKTAASRKRKALCLTSEKLPETPTSCFASIIPENIKLVYLRRSLIEELLKDPDTFESKVVGSYVRIKCDPNDCSQKNSHQLLEVTGVRKAPECGDGGAEYFLEATHFFKEIPFSELSNDHFKTEECDDLRQRIITGSFRRPTVMEFQQKAQILHKFLTKQWISRELTLLQNQIEHANIKGWRRELCEYLKRKELLQKPAEQERLLLEVPNVIAEPLEPEVIVHEPAEDENTDKCCLPQSTIAGISEDVPFNIEADKSLSNDNSCSTDPAVLHKRYVVANLISMMTVMADKHITGDTTSGVQTLDDKKTKKSDTPSAGTDGTVNTEAVKSDDESPKKKDKGSKKERDRSKGGKEPKSGRLSRKKKPRTSVEKKSPTDDDGDDEDGENPNAEEFLQSGGRQVVNYDEYEGGNSEPLPAHFFSVARGEREPVMNLTQPEGEEGWSMMDFRTYEGFSSDKGRKPTDALKAFEIPADQARYGAMPTREFFERSHVALGVSISYQVHIHKMLHDTLHKAVSAERQVAELIVDKYDLSVKVKGMETAANNLKKDLEDRDEEIKNLKADKNKLTADLEKALEEARTKADEDRKEIERLRNVVESSYRDHVRNFVNTQGFVDFINARAAPAFAIGYDSCAEFIGEGNTFVSDKHGLGAFLNWGKANPDALGKMRSNRHAEPPLTASADKKFEIGVKQIESFVGKADKTDSEQV